MHIFEALMKDHKKLKELLKELVSLKDDDFESRNNLVQDIRDELVPHSRAEEAVFYDSLRALDADKKVIMHGFTEHMEAEALLRLLQVEEKAHLGWKATARKLKDAVEHHIHEEEKDIFATARTVLTAEEAKKLGELFENLKPQIREEGFLKNSVELVVNMMPVRLAAAVKKVGIGRPTH
jgi:hemerythrin-like domain-containing protein